MSRKEAKKIIKKAEKAELKLSANYLDLEKT